MDNADHEALENWIGKLENALQESERLALANRYTAVVMHEVNNPLEAIVNLAYLLQQEEMSSAAHSFLNSIQEQLTVLTEITRPSLGFHREQRAAREINLRELIDSVEKLHGGRLSQEGIALHRRCPETILCGVVGSEVMQLLSNLVLNAFEALCQTRQGAHIHLRVSCLAGGVSLLVADDGPGIPPELERSLFEAHVTGKPNGSGLGLWISERIVRSHGGRIRVRTSRRAGRSGTAFRIFLPCTKQLRRRRIRRLPAVSESLRHRHCHLYEAS